MNECHTVSVYFFVLQDDMYSILIVKNKKQFPEVFHENVVFLNFATFTGVSGIPQMYHKKDALDGSFLKELDELRQEQEIFCRVITII